MNPIKVKRTKPNIFLYRMRGKNKYLAKRYGKAKFFNTEGEAEIWIENQIKRRGKKRLNLKDLNKK